jgi:hypothetical protein
MQAWEDLEARLPRVAQTLDLHYISGYPIDDVATMLGRSYISGYPIDDVATMLGRSLRTSVLDLRLGHAWLARALNRQRAFAEL